METLTVFAQEVVRPANDELVDLDEQILLSLIATFSLFLGCVAIAAFEDRHLKLFVKLLLRAEVARVAKVEQRKVLVQVILRFGSAMKASSRERPERDDDDDILTHLYRSTCEDDASFAVDLHQGSVGAVRCNDSKA